MLTKDYILSQELAQMLGVHIATFSNWYNDYPDYVDNGLIIKYGNCTFFNKDLPLFVLSRREWIQNNIGKFTDFTNSYPITYLKSEFNFDPYFSRGYGELFNVCNKNFFKFNEYTAKKIKNKTLYPMNKQELNEYLLDDNVDYLHVSKNNYIVYY